MDIRKGNDIKINFDLSKINILNVDSLKRIRCFFLRNDFCECECKQVPPFSNPTQYTIHDCGIPVYNVHALKHGYDPHHCDPHDRGFCVHDGWYAKDAYSTSVFELIEDENPKVSVTFKANAQKIGNYRVVLEVVNREDIGDFKKNHQYRFDFGYPFRITDDVEAYQGDVSIDMFTVEQSFEYATTDQVNKLINDLRLELYRLSDRVGTSILELDEKHDQDIKDLYSTIDSTTEHIYDLSEEHDDIDVTYVENSPYVDTIQFTLNHPAYIQVFVKEHIGSTIITISNPTASQGGSDVITENNKWYSLGLYPAGEYTIYGNRTIISKLSCSCIAESQYYYELKWNNAISQTRQDVINTDQRVNGIDSNITKLKRDIDTLEESLVEYVDDLEDRLSQAQVIPVATSESNGLMSAEDKSKLNDIFYTISEDLADTYATKTWIEDQNYLTQHQSFFDYAKLSDILNTSNFALKSDLPNMNNYATLSDIPDMSNYPNKSDLVTINGQSIIEGGNIEIHANSDVTSVNGQTGAVTLNIPTVPTKISAFANDLDYVSKSEVRDLLKQWYGTLEEYENLLNKDSDTIYNIYEDKYIQDYDD